MSLRFKMFKLLLIGILIDRRIIIDKFSDSEK